jgi:hypothetical protein
MNNEQSPNTFAPAYIAEVQIAEGMMPTAILVESEAQNDATIPDGTELFHIDGIGVNYAPSLKDMKNQALNFDGLDAQDRVRIKYASDEDELRQILRGSNANMSGGGSSGGGGGGRAQQSSSGGGGRQQPSGGGGRQESRGGGGGSSLVDQKDVILSRYEGDLTNSQYAKIRYSNDPDVIAKVLAEAGIGGGRGASSQPKPQQQETPKQSQVQKLAGKYPDLAAAYRADQLANNPRYAGNLYQQMTQKGILTEKDMRIMREGSNELKDRVRAKIETYKQELRQEVTEAGSDLQWYKEHHGHADLMDKQKSPIDVYIFEPISNAVETMKINAAKNTIESGSYMVTETAKHLNPLHYAEEMKKDFEHYTGKVKRLLESKDTRERREADQVAREEDFKSAKFRRAYEHAFNESNISSADKELYERVEGLKPIEQGNKFKRALRALGLG